METSVERLVPEEIFCAGMYRPVVKVVAHPPGTFSAPIRPELTAVEIITAFGSRWLGTSKAWIGSDLRMHVMVDSRDEVRSGWEQAS